MRFRPRPPPGDFTGSFSSAALGFRPLLGGVATGSGTGASAASTASVASVASPALGLGVGDFLSFAGPGGGVIVHRRLEPKVSRFDQYDPESPVENKILINTLCKSYSTIEYLIKVEFLSVISIFGLKMIVKSGIRTHFFEILPMGESIF